MRTITRAGKSLQIIGYILLFTALLVRGWIPILLLIIVALIMERRVVAAEDVC